MCFARRKRSRTDRRPGLAGILVLAALVAGCAAISRTSSIEPEARIEVLGPEPGFSARALPSDWVIEGEVAPEARLDAVVKDGVPALRIAGGERGFVLARPTDAPLPVSPYLSWARIIELADNDIHPVSLVVGFHGGESAAGGRRAALSPWFGTALPPHDRRLLIGWGGGAYQPDRLAPSEVASRIRHFVQRPGPEALTSWRLETVDLAALYARAWPGDDAARVRVVFIGIAVTGDRPGTAYLSGVLLSR